MRFGLRLMFVATTMSAIVLGVGWPLYRSYTEEFVVYSKGVTVGAEWGWIESTEMLASKANATFIFHIALATYHKQIGKVLSVQP